MKDVLDLEEAISTKMKNDQKAVSAKMNKEILEAMKEKGED